MLLQLISARACTAPLWLSIYENDLFLLPRQSQSYDTTLVCILIEQEEIGVGGSNDCSGYLGGFRRSKQMIARRHFREVTEVIPGTVIINYDASPQSSKAWNDFFLVTVVCLLACSLYCITHCSTIPLQWSRSSSSRASCRMLYLGLEHDKS